ncbi:flagellar hook assembly protein FlgD [Pleionea litopenaei]|uniref:Basal-body rod modification protein FlgD n=1 Tax=Pleionea litopenaei TaxID=3070815 RepID=A0AA51RU41_9GAMM|nr:flagellar hook assembly protein FlgD [Pleionea sp. HL-JVS1]WMS87642.1 flagellar hook assembly protein FlgD [Pleionea sp. HL-JVS1]
MTTINNETSSLYNDLGLNREENLNNGKKDQLGQSDFLALLTTQLANQDPFDPLDNKEFIAQMAQFSSLSGMEELNTNFNTLATSLTGSQALQASALVGRSVMVPTSVGYLQQGQSIEGRLSLQQSTQDIWAEVKDSSGQVVRRFEIGSYSQGDLDFAWDGLSDNGEAMPEGAYSINVFGRVGGSTEQLGTVIKAQVNSVNLAGSNGQVVLNLTGLGSVNLGDIDEIGL